MFSLGNDTIKWSSKKESTIALSSTMAEYRGAIVVACEVGWLQKLLVDLGQSISGAVVIYYDNISTIMLSNNRVYHTRTKHIDVHYHFVREKVLAREVDLFMSALRSRWLASSQRTWV